MMYSVKEISVLVNEAIKKRKFPTEPAELYEPLEYIMQLEGKRFRPCLLLLAKNLFSNEISDSIDLAVAVEYFHTFTLIHDDIMDDAPLRRGKPTIHEKWNSNIAILSGDVMFVAAFELISSAPDKHLSQILRIFNKMAREVCEGQQFDMNFESRKHVTIDEYLKMISLKTAVLLGASLEIGAVLGNASAVDASHLYHFGLNMGIAFQLRDDMLDVYGSPEIFGKRVGGDILANKKTYLLLKALEEADASVKNQLEGFLTKNYLEPSLKISQVKSIYDSLNIDELAAETINFYSSEAFKHLAGLNLPEERKQILLNFCAEFSKRQS